MTDPERPMVTAPPLQAGMPVLDDVSQAFRAGNVGEPGGLTPTDFDVMHAELVEGERLVRVARYGESLGSSLHGVIEAERAFGGTKSRTRQEAGSLVVARMRFFKEELLARQDKNLRRRGQQAITEYIDSLVQPAPDSAEILP